MYGQLLLEKKFINMENKITNKEKIDYIIYFNKSAVYDTLEDEIFKNSEIIYQNDAGGIVKYNKRGKKWNY